MWARVNTTGVCSGVSYVGSVCSNQLKSWQQCALQTQIGTVLINNSGNLNETEKMIVQIISDLRELKIEGQ